MELTASTEVHSARICVAVEDPQVTIVGARADGPDGVRSPFGNWDSLSMPMTEHPFIAITPVAR